MIKKYLISKGWKISFRNHGAFVIGIAVLCWSFEWKHVIFNLGRRYIECEKETVEKN